MGYMCINRAVECTGCNECKKQPELLCEQCDTPIYEGDLYYEIDGEVYCEECVKDTFGKYA